MEKLHISYAPIVDKQDLEKRLDINFKKLFGACSNQNYIELDIREKEIDFLIRLKEDFDKKVRDGGINKILEVTYCWEMYLITKEIELISFIRDQLGADCNDYATVLIHNFD